MHFVERVNDLQVRADRRGLPIFVDATFAEGAYPSPPRRRVTDEVLREPFVFRKLDQLPPGSP